MRALPDDIRIWLLESLPAITGRPERPFDVEPERRIARPEAEIYFCTLRWPTDSMRVCVKRFTTFRPRDLLSLFQRALSLQETMAASGISYARVLACNAPLAVMVMSMVPGASLERRIVHSFFRGRLAVESCNSTMRRTASAVAAMHSLPIPRQAPMAKRCSNNEYVARLRRSALGNSFVAKTLEGSAFDPARIIEALPASFWERQEDRLLHGDFQAKNVLVTSEQQPTLIDIDYGIGHPLRDVAQFLTQLERLHRRWRLPRARRLLRTYGETFCEQFAREGFAYLMDDLPFFRLWTIAFSLLSDQHSPPPLRRLIRHDLQEESPGLIFSPTRCNWVQGTQTPNGGGPR